MASRSRSPVRGDAVEWAKRYLDELYKTDADTRSMYRTRLREKFAHDDTCRTGCFETRWLGNVVAELDRMYFDGYLLYYLTQLRGGLRIGPRANMGTSIGFVFSPSESDKKIDRYITLEMNAEIIAAIFQGTEPAYQAGGFTCTTRFECFLYCLEHEFIHVFMWLCVDLGLRNDDADHHDTQFTSMLRRMFAHTSRMHGITPGVPSAPLDRQRIRNSIARLVPRITSDEDDSNDEDEKSTDQFWVYSPFSDAYVNVVVVPDEDVRPKKLVRAAKQFHKSDYAGNVVFITKVGGEGRHVAVHVDALSLENMQTHVDAYQKRSTITCDRGRSENRYCIVTRDTPEGSHKFVRGSHAGYQQLLAKDISQK